MPRLVRRVISLYLLTNLTPAFAKVGDGLTAPTRDFRSFKHELTRREAIENSALTFTDAQRQTFWTSGWPTVLAIARDNGLELADMLSDPLDVIDLETEDCGRFLELQPIHPSVGDSTRTALRYLSTLDLTKARWTQDEQILVDLGLVTLHGLAASILLFRAKLGEGPSLDPFAPIDEVWVSEFMRLMQELTLDAGLILSRKNEAMAELMNYFKSRGEWDDEMPSNESLPSAPEFMTLVRDEPLALVEGRAYDFMLIDHTGEFEPGVEITLEKRVVDELRGSHAVQAHRLLKTLLMPQTHKSGLKKLTSLSPGMFELKAVMRGHWRILGCRDGQHLRLIEMREMPNTVAGYSRIIPSNYCQ